ncbi:MAG: ABC transporter ATP-binding protein [[Clostridium] symbiosum]|nr:ABC transporter ATP-binding protein [[Clostridium] symbiosum]
MSNTSNVSDKGYQEEAVSIENLTVTYGETPAIAGVSLHVKNGDFLGIIGPNGGGKTTLLKAILGLIPARTGEIFVYGKKAGKVGKLIGYVPQITVLDKSFPITVHEVVLTGLLKPSFTLFHKYTQQDKDKADTYLNQVGIYKLRDRMISDLSGGEFQRMLIARALAAEPKLLLLDEPTASVDVNSSDQIFSLLQELNKSITIIMVTHDLFAVASHVKTLACVNGKLVYHGDPQLNEEIAQALYGCPIDHITHGIPLKTVDNRKEEM